MDVTKEVRCRLKEISKLWNEIEDILCKNKYENEEPKNTSCFCICLQESADADNQTNDSEDKVCCRTLKAKRKLHKIEYPEEQYVKCEDLCREKMSTNFDDSGLYYSRKNLKNNCDKITSTAILSDMLRNMSSKKTNKKTQKDRDRENFKNNINDVRQKFLLYFNEANKDRTSTHGL